MAQCQFRSDDTTRWPFGVGFYSDGDRTISTDTTESTVGASFSGTASATTGSGTNAGFAPGQTVLIIQSRGTGVGQWQFNLITGYSAGTITFALPLMYTYTDSGASQAQIIVMKQYKHLTLDAAKTWSPPAWDGDQGGILCAFADEIDINGIIDLVGKGYRGGSSSNNNNVTGSTGEGTTGASVGGQSTRNGTGGGGGPSFSSQDHDGCGGGHATAGSAGSDGGEGGTTGGASDLTLMIFGGAGGGDCASSNGDSGGNSAGILILVARRITVNATTGEIRFSGQTGNRTGSKWPGAGSGGSVLLKGMDITLGTGRITGSGIANGPTSGDGRIHVDYSVSISGSASPTVDQRSDNTILPRSSGAAVFF